MLGRRLLKREISKLRKKNKKNKDKILDDDLKFLQLNLLHGHKCRKTLINQLYKINTVEYRNCVMKKGKK